MRRNPPHLRIIGLALLGVVGCDANATNPPENPGPDPVPAITLSATTLEFAAVSAGADPEPQTVSVTNGGEGSLSGLELTVDYADDGAADWLGAELDEDVAPATLTVTPAVGDLPAGTFEATITVSGAGADPRDVTVTLGLEAQPAIGLSRTTAEFTAVAAGADPDPMTVEVANDGGGELSGLEAAVAYGQGEPTGWLDAGLSGTTAPATLTLTSSVDGLDAGTYHATVAVSDAAAANTPRSVAVTFTVEEQPAITLSASDVAFSTVAGSADPSPTVVEVGNGGGGTLGGLEVSVAYEAGQPTGWLDAALSAPSAPATLTLTPTGAALDPGTYQATASVAAAAAANSPRDVAVAFTVIRDPATYVGSYDLAPTPTVTCDMETFGDLDLTVTSAGITGANLDVLEFGLTITGSTIGLSFPVSWDLALPLDPIGQTFSGAGPLIFDQSGDLYDLTGTGTISIDGAFTGADTFVVDLMVELELELDTGAGGTINSVCTPVDAEITGTRS